VLEHVFGQADEDPEGETERSARYVILPEQAERLLELAADAPTLEDEFMQLERERDFLGDLVGDDEWVRSFAYSLQRLSGLGLLDEQMALRLLVALGLGAGEEGFTGDEYLAVLRWANDAVIAHTTLELVLKGICTVRPDEAGEIAFSLRSDFGRT
jgi:hypothetical protein